jgi:hypothetical protein
MCVLVKIKRLAMYSTLHFYLKSAIGGAPPSKNVVSIWLLNWYACMCTNSREEAAWRRGPRERKGRRGGRRRNARNSVWKFGTGDRKCRWRARAYPKRENQLVLPLQPSEVLAPCKAHWVWAGVVAKFWFWPRTHCSLPRPAAP